MGRIVLIVFGVIGGLVLAFGALGVLIAATSPGPDQADTYTGAIFFIVVGAVIAVPCTFFAASQSGAVFVTLTDRRIIALIAGQYGGLASRVGLIEPRTSVSVKAR